LDSNGSRRLARIQSTEKDLNEDWLQELLFKNPSLLPSMEIEPAFYPLIPLARELPTKAGLIDLIFISPLGYITIVETKLFRNPEARREVVVQILDYSKELSQWTYDDLNEAIGRARKHRVKGEDSDLIFKSVSENQEDPEFDQNQFQRNVNQTLRHARFLLLIVGDQIREDVEWLVQYLENFAHLQFKMGLVELGLYRLDKNQEYPLIIFPSVVARTNEIIRAIVRIEGDENFAKLPIVIAPGGESITTPSRETFLQDVTGKQDAGPPEKLAKFLNRLEELGAFVDPITTGIALRFPDPGGGDKDFRLFRIAKDGRVWVGDVLKRQLEREGYDGHIALQYAEKLSKMVGGKVDSQRGMLITGDADRMFPIKYLSDAHQDEYVDLVRDLLDRIRANADQQKKRS
jgi:hypothetical protein